MTAPPLVPPSGLHWPLRLLIAGASIVIIVAGLRAIAPILSVFLFALLLAMVLSPAMLWLIRRKVPRGVAVTLTLLLVFLVGGTVLYMVAGSLAQLRGKLPEYQDRLVQVEQQLTAVASRHLEPDRLAKLKSVIHPGQLAGPAAKMAGRMIEDLGHGLFILLLTAFFLVEFSLLFPRVEASGRSPRDFVVRFAELVEDVQKYMGINAVVGLIGATFYTILLKAMDVPFAPTWVVLYFFLGFIPAIGGILAVLPVLALILLEQGLRQVLIFVPIFVIFNFVNGDVIKPRIVKGGFDLSIVAVFFSLVFWNYVLGPVGVILAVPLSVTLKKLYQEFGPDLRSALLA